MTYFCSSYIAREEIIDLKCRYDPFPPNGGIPPFFSADLFFLNFFFRVSAVVSMNYYMFYFNISAFWLVHQVYVREVDISAEIELWQRSISHGRSKLNICIFNVYVYIYNTTYFVFVKSCFISLVTDILIYYNIDTYSFC